MKVMIVSRGIPSEEYSTNGIFEFDQAKALAKAGCEVIFAVLDLRSVRRKRKYGFAGWEEGTLHVRSVSVPLGNIPKALFYAIGERALSALYQRIVAEFGQPDLIHAHFTDQAYLCAKLLKNQPPTLVSTSNPVANTPPSLNKDSFPNQNPTPVCVSNSAANAPCVSNPSANMPPSPNKDSFPNQNPTPVCVSNSAANAPCVPGLVVTEHSSLLNRAVLPKAVQKAARVAYQAADKVIVVSPALGRRLEERFGCACDCVPNLVDTDLFCWKERVADGKFRFVASGNLIPLKRMNLTIEAFAQAFGKREEVELVIFGGGVLQKELQKQIESYHLEKRITLKGRRPREEISAALHESDCFVLASSSETFGVVYIEAMACGVPVIATRCGGPDDYIDKDNGIMVEVDDLEGLKNAMLALYSQPERYNRKEIAARTARAFSSEAVAQLLLAEYEVAGASRTGAGRTAAGVS